MNRQDNNPEDAGRDTRDPSDVAATSAADSDVAATSAAAPAAWRRFLSHDSGPFAQFVKYGAIGVASTLVQMVVFYLLASTVCRCLGPDDWAVKWFGLPQVDVSHVVRGFRFAVDTVLGFTVANVFCWLMNRAFVFRPGKFAWYKEFGMFFCAAAGAMALATGLSWMLINWVGLQTTTAVVIEIVVSFLVNFFVRKFFIFKG
jgi:putative flippase GtrA